MSRRRCPDPPCNCPPPPPPPPECCMEVAFSTAPNCIGGTYNLAQNMAPPEGVLKRWACWAYNPCFSTNPTLLVVELTESGGLWWVTVTVDGHTWQESYITEPDLCAFVGESISSDSSGDCDTSGTTATLTANDGPCPRCGGPDCNDVCLLGYASWDDSEVSVDIENIDLYEDWGCPASGSCSEIIANQTYILGIAGSGLCYWLTGTDYNMCSGWLNFTLEVRPLSKPGNKFSIWAKLRIHFFTGSICQEAEYESPDLEGCQDCFPGGQIVIPKYYEMNNATSYACGNRCRATSPYAGTVFQDNLTINLL